MTEQPPEKCPHCGAELAVGCTSTFTCGYSEHTGARGYQCYETEIANQQSRIEELQTLLSQASYMLLELRAENARLLSLAVLGRLVLNSMDRTAHQYVTQQLIGLPYLSFAAACDNLYSLSPWPDGDWVLYGPSYGDDGPIEPTIAKHADWVDCLKDSPLWDAALAQIHEPKEAPDAT